MAQDVKLLFYLLVLLIVVAYFVGAATDITALSNGLVKLGYAFSGRNSNGDFVAYPSGGGTAVTK